MDLLSDVETIAGANSVEDVWQLLSKRLGDYGFDRVIY
ncbi:MAG: LuxR family transcriptional regulator, partial [Mangrovicoccus sp.]|nr:LuxR family transcriptional regulator [Mangrovicoccus sp.]